MLICGPGSSRYVLSSVLILNISKIITQASNNYFLITTILVLNEKGFGSRLAGQGCITLWDYQLIKIQTSREAQHHVFI